MRFSRMRRVVGAAAVGAGLTVLSGPAGAAPSLVVQDGETVVLGGTVLFKSVTVASGGTLRVRPVTDGEVGSGSLTLKAEVVTVALGGVVELSGAGFAGTAAAGGAAPCCPATSGGAGLSGPQLSPGGGGGSGGKGAPGCLAGGLGIGGPGGDAFVNVLAGNPGAAGGAAFFLDAAGDLPNRGGRGGGALTILAATVQLDGQILANGLPGIAFGGTGTGGGAGGFVAIDAVTVTGEGRIEARGGAGSPALASSGGGGGGGVIWIQTRTPLSPDGSGGTLPQKDVRGGDTNAADSGCADGDAGVLELVEDPAHCVDADGDGQLPSVCAGAVGADDCDDSDATVQGGSKAAVEICDGVDNDCNGEVDDLVVADACPAGQSCKSGACQDDGSGGAGGGAGGGDGEAPDFVAYRGACSFDAQRAAHENGAAFFAAALMAFLVGLRVSRRGRR